MDSAAAAAGTSKLVSGMSDIGSASAAGGKTEKLYVAIRSRPLNARELGTNASEAWRIDETDHTIVPCNTKESGGSNQTFQFDEVFGADASTNTVYSKCASNVIHSALKGVSGTVFAYGQTSSGKTFTMQGVIARAIEDIFTQRKEHHTERQYTISMSYIEIYNEEIRDLLNPKSGTNLKVHDDGV